MTSYRGRFAPSPSGPLHTGSLLAATLSFLDAKAHQGHWLVRIEDIDPPREMAGASKLILDCLYQHALIPDEPVFYQSGQSSRYNAILQSLNDLQRIYYCPCSRKQLHELQHHLPDCPRSKYQKEITAIRFRVNQKIWQWDDGFLGNMSEILCEDFVLRRRDGLYAYQLAVVADDIAQNISHVVRGSDLIQSTPMQLSLFDALKQTPPRYSHFPVLRDSAGNKLSKQTFAPEVDSSDPVQNLRDIFKLLGLIAPENITSCSALLAFGVAAWQQQLKKANNKPSFAY